MRHAYLILAHNEFRQLQRLIDAIDNPDADIFVHIDRNVKQMPVLRTSSSNLRMIDDRIHVIWGDATQIAAEYILLEHAIATGDYDRFTIISGTHYPLRPIADIQSCLDNYGEASIVQPMTVTDEEIKMKIGHYHYFLTHLSSKTYWLNRLYHYLWRIALYPQRRFCKGRDASFLNGKVSQWCSLTTDAVKHIISRKDEMLATFRHTFCSDEFFVMAALKGSGLPIKAISNFTFTDFAASSPKILNPTDFKRLVESDCLFARKFTDQSSGVIKQLKQHIHATHK